MNAKFYALFIENPDRFLSKEESLHLENCEHLCKEFGGEFLRVRNSNIVDTIAMIADEKRITQIVLGESQQSRLKHLLRGSFTQRIIRKIWQKQIDLHIITTNKS